MSFTGCQSKSKEITIEEKRCPRCGAEIEIFSVDAEAKCPDCGFTVYNDTMSCVLWCRYARECVGEELYEKMKEVARRREERKQLAEE
ncbi:MAG: hypothetical protein IJM42_03060 [Synergistes sp.]|nr:hypothetical protein [Synergistes sp.]